MQLGAFSVSLAVKDIEASRAFYEKFGFIQFAGNPAHNYLILKNGDYIIGIFQGMFEKNILTFNPGWDSNAQLLPSFTDVRELQRHAPPFEHGKPAVHPREGRERPVLRDVGHADAHLPVRGGRPGPQFAGDPAAVAPGRGGHLVHADALHGSNRPSSR